MTDNQRVELLKKNSLVKEISEREVIIQTYQQTGFLNRDRAIYIINQLRVTNENVAKATCVELTIGSTPFPQASND